MRSWPTPPKPPIDNSRPSCYSPPTLGKNRPGGRPMWRRFLILSAGLLAGCQGTGYDRIPATVVDNPDPLLGGAAKPRQDGSPQTGPAPQDGFRPSAPVAATPTAQPGAAAPAQPIDRIGPLTASPSPKTGPSQPAQPGMTPATASLALGVRQPAYDSPIDQQVQPASGFIPTPNPQAVQKYRQQLTDLGAIGLRTRQLDATHWLAAGNFPETGRPNSIRRVEAQGLTEADALLAIVEQLEK
jgi:hypothetical protein